MFLEVRYAVVGQRQSDGRAHKNKNDTQSMDSFAFSAPEISLPKYGKAARGMGENFTVNLVIGARSVGGLI